VRLLARLSLLVSLYVASFSFAISCLDTLKFSIRNQDVTLTAINPEAPATERPLQEIYNLFKSASGDVERENFNSDIEALRRNPTYSMGAAFLARDAEGKLIAAATARVSKKFSLLQGTPLQNKRVGYLALSAVDTGFQGSGIYQVVNRRRVNWLVIDNKVNYVCVRTQNPKVFASTQSALEELVKSGEIKSFTLAQKTHSIGVYGQQLTATKATIDDPEVSREFENLNYARGDANIFVWQVER